MVGKSFLVYIKFIEDGALAQCAKYTVKSLSQARLGLAQITLDLNPIENSKIQTENLQRHGKTITHGPHLGGKCVDMLYIVDITPVT